MRLGRISKLTMAALFMSAVCYAQDWQRLSAVLMTPWGEQIDPEHVWEEYPRPQLVRQDWMNLNGVWGYFPRSNSSLMTYEPNKNKFTQAILVPFGVESALSGIMHKDLGTVSKSVLMYRRTFTLTDAFKGKRTLLHFGAVDWRCSVYVNRTKVGTHDGGSDPFTFDITDYLKEEGEQELQVSVYDPSSSGGQPRGKQTTNPSSIWYTSCSGIWQTVWLEPVSDCYIERYEVVPDAATGTARVKVIGNDPTCKFYLVARDGEDIVATTDKVRVGEEVTLTIPNAKLWSPDSPFLYNLDIYMCRDNCEECDHARGYFGLRTLTRAMIDGHPGFLLNGKPLFMYGPLDQGWWPDGLLTPPSYEAMIYDLKTIKALGMNMVRKHIKVEPDLWYEWCDRNGLIVWQDMPSGSEGGSIGNKQAIQHNFYTECEHIVTALKQHPCIGLWVVYNEGWGQDADAGGGHTMRGYLTVRNADADMGRLMNSVSGWTDFEIGDVVDTHSYPAPNGNSNKRNERINVCGEFGGITLMIDGHLWAGSQQTYTQVSNSEEYTERFNQYTMALQSLQQSKNLWAGVYTQITDVEQEVNGILTYDRKVLKVNEEQLASIRENIEKTIQQRMKPAVSVVSAGDNSTSINWKYVTTNPGEGWNTPDYDDSKWSQGKAGFGKIDQPDARVQTTWSTAHIWIRRHFTIKNVDENNLKDLCLRIFYDEDTEVYINGVLALSVTGYNTTYQLFDISKEARQAINLSGDNVIAIHTKQTSGGQYIDAGFSLRSYKDNSELTIEPMADLNLPQAVEDTENAYLLCYSKENSQKMFYAYSLNGVNWQIMNEGKSVFDGLENVKFPFVYRQDNETPGKPLFHLVYGGNNTTIGLYHWTSEDLLHWNPINDVNGKLLDVIAQSPEIQYDPETEAYIYYWSEADGSNWDFHYMRTKDFTSFSRPLSYFSPGYSSKDLHIFNVGPKEYMAIFTNTEDNSLNLAYSTSLTPSRGKFKNFANAFTTKRKLSLPTTYPSFDKKGWFLSCKEDQGHSLFSAATASSKDIVWRPCENYSDNIPSEANGGKVVVIKRSELENLLSVLDGTFTPVTVPAQASQPNEDIYTLQGLRVTKPIQHGVYITKGQKQLK